MSSDKFNWKENELEIGDSICDFCRNNNKNNKDICIAYPNGKEIINNECEFFKDNTPDILDGESMGDYYLFNLKKAYFENGKINEWNDFMDKFKGISDEDLSNLLNEYPETPKSLIDILKNIDGTNYKKLGEENYCLLFFNSDVEDGKYPYYLLSGKEMLDTKDEYLNYDYFINREFEDLYVDEKITNDINNVKWLHFSDCVNSGGTSQLFIDFTPSEKGKKGQVIRVLHDVDEIRVIADDFDSYLDMVIKNNFKFFETL